MKNNVFLLDVPEKSENDAIGYDVYVDSVISSINSGAKMIGLLSNYGSGKSTIINMVEEKMRNDSSSNIEFVKVNLWKINELENDKSNVTHSLDSTIDIHKTLLKKLINKLPKESNKDYFNKKVDSNFTLFNIVTKRKSDIFNLYLILALFIFNLIAKIDLPGFSVPNFILFIVDLIVVIFLIVFLYDSKLYISFKKDSTERKIDENDTIDCFNEIVKEFFSTHSNLDKLIISIEDLDRYNDSVFVIKVLEQIYKFYNENSEKKVVFIISLKPPYLLLEDSSNKGDNFSEGLIIESSTYKELYEKIFDFIINLQTISFQNYGSVLVELIKEKSQQLLDMGLEIPKNEDEIGVWRYLYTGNNVSIRDIKHRFNFFLILYTSLYQHKLTLLTPELIDINLETCLFVSYLEDEYSACFYKLVNDPKKFSDIISDYLINKSFKSLDLSDEFHNEIKNALSKGLIKEDYTMYFYKYPKNKPIKNIFDTAVQNAIFTNTNKGIPNFDDYCNKASEDVVFKAIREKCEAKQFPSIIFVNKVLYEQTKRNFSTQITDYLENNCLFTSEKGTKEVQSMLLKIVKLQDEWILELYLDLLKNDLCINFEDEDIIKYRLDILNVLGPNINYLLKFYDANMPLIIINELKYFISVKSIFELFPVEKINEDVYPLIDYIVKNSELEFKTIIEFLDMIKDVDKKVFREIFYMFDFTKYSKKLRKSLYRKGYAAFDFEDLDELEVFVSKVKVLPVDIERKIIKYLRNLSSEERKAFESKYVKILNHMGSISSDANKYIPEFIYFYTHTADIENELYKKGFYNQYCYSKFNRLKHMVYEVDKFEVLKPYYLSYFKDKKFTSDYKFDLVVLKHIKNNLSYENLTFDKIQILNKLPQTTDDFECVCSGNYANVEPSSIMDNLRTYLRAMVAVDSSCEQEFVENIIELVQSRQLRLSKKSFDHIKSLLSKGNKIRINKIKDLCTGN